MSSLTPPLTSRLRAASSASLPLTPQALTHWLRRVRHWLAFTRERRAVVTPVQMPKAAREACAEEGARTEFGTVQLGGQRYGAIYVDGKLSCLLPGVERL